MVRRCHFIFFSMFQLFHSFRHFFSGGELTDGSSFGGRQSDKLLDLKLELGELEREEKFLDTHLEWLRHVSVDFLGDLNWVVMTCEFS